MSEKTRTIFTSKQIRESTICDICGKEVFGEKEPLDWYYLSVGHSEWEGGAEEFDLCSPQCFAKLVRAEENHYGAYESGYIGDMPYKFAKALIDWAERKEE